MEDDDVLLEARSIFNLANWDGSIIGWMERDIDQYPKEGTVASRLMEGNPAFNPEKYSLGRERGQQLLAASKAALEILRNDPSLIAEFIEPYRRVLHDEHEVISRIHLRILDRLVREGRIRIERDPMAYAGFAYLFYSYGIDGVEKQVGIRE